MFGRYKIDLNLSLSCGDGESILKAQCGTGATIDEGGGIRSWTATC